jgi:hypothetical protein
MFNIKFSTEAHALRAKKLLTPYGYRMNVRKISTSQGCAYEMQIRGYFYNSNAAYSQIIRFLNANNIPYIKEN